MSNARYFKLSRSLHDILDFYATLPEWKGDKCLTPYSRNKFGDYPLNVASTRGMVEEIDILIKNGANIHLRGEHGYSPLHNAVESGVLDAVQFLISHGANIREVNDDNISPIQLSDYLNEKAIFDYFLSNP